LLKIFKILLACVNKMYLLCNSKYFPNECETLKNAPRYTKPDGSIIIAVQMYGETQLKKTKKE
jgi:hypothetical protein